MLESSREIRKTLVFSEEMAMRYFNIHKVEKLFFKEHRDFKSFMKEMSFQNIAPNKNLFTYQDQRDPNKGLIVF